MHFLHIALLRQLPFREHIADVPRDDRLISAKQLSHLGLCQPDRLSLQPDIHPYLAIRRLVDDHLADGNKRIGTLFFLEYLRRNGLLTRADGAPRLADNAMVALALLIAESEPKQKDLMIRLVLNLLGDEGP